MKILLNLVFFFLLTHGQAQEKLPVLSLPAAPSDKPVILYISGDGGLNDFTTSLTGSLNKKGYPVQVINARSYFWKKKTPQEAASAISNFLSTHAAQHLLCIGYSFGADVWPFIISNLPATIQAKITGLVLIAPAASTDFEIHFSEMLGFNKDHAFKVVDGLNALSIPKTLAIVDAGDSEFPSTQVHQPGFKLIKLTGGHHFDNNAPLLCSIITDNFER